MALTASEIQAALNSKAFKTQTNKIVPVIARGVGIPTAAVRRFVETQAAGQEKFGLVEDDVNLRLNDTPDGNDALAERNKVRRFYEELLPVFADENITTPLHVKCMYQTTADQGMNGLVILYCVGIDGQVYMSDNIPHVAPRKAV